MFREDFTKIEEIDHGAFGKLYKAHQPKLGRDVALKVINSSIEGAPDALAHARAIAKVEHDNIVKIYSIENLDLLGNDECNDVIVMQWLSGKTLESRLAEARFSEKDAIAICIGVIEGLAALHRGNVAHGDLHCNNIMITEGCRPVIIDVHPIEQAFLSQQPLTTRGAKISQDIAFCRTVVIRTLRHSMVSAVATANLDTNIVRAETLEDIKKVVAGYGDNKDALEAASEESSSLIDKVAEYIENRKNISLRQLVVNETKAVSEVLVSDRFSCMLSEIGSNTIRQRIEEYETMLKPLLTILSAGSFWGNRDHQKLWVETIESLANSYENIDPSKRGGKTILLDLQLYPPLVALYVAGFTAWTNERYETLYCILRTTKYIKFQKTEPLAYELFYWKAKNKEMWNAHVLDGEKNYVPISDHLVGIVTKYIEPVTSIGQKLLEDSFDDFEYFLGLVEAYGTGAHVDQSDTCWGPVGRFIWRFGTRRSKGTKGEEFIQRFNDPNWKALEVGFFGNKLDHFVKTVQKFENFCSLVRNQFHIF